MKKNTLRMCMIVALTTILPVMVMSQGQISTLMVSGHPGRVPVTRINGKNYVEIEVLAHMTNGSLSFSGDQVTLTLPAVGEIEKAAGEATAATKTGFSREFLRAGIEALSTMREWHSALASAIENQFPVALSWQAPFEARATTNLRLAHVAATTDSDRNAAQLIANVYQKMRQLSNKYVTQRANLNYIAPDSLKNDVLDQNIITCGRSLGAMMASGQFVDDGTCQ